MFSDFNCIYSNNFKYPYGIEEIRGMVEYTITQILFNARLRAFNSQPYYIVEFDSETNLLQTELILMDSVDGYSESREKHDLKRLNEHYRALKIKCAKHYDKMCDQYNNSQIQYQQNHIASIFCTSLESMFIHEMDFAKENQYFLEFNLEFVSLRRAVYDRTGRTCFLKFKIQ